MKQNHPPVTLEDYSSGAKINAKKLVNLVRPHEVLYNSRANVDKVQKIRIWESIYPKLFPGYEALSEDFKVAIRLNVRRRWKKLRDTIAAEVRKCPTVEDYLRKKQSPLISELEFLIPYIRSEHCSKLADALGLRDNFFIPSYNDVESDEEDPNAQIFNNLIDLTAGEEECDIKSEIFDLSSEDSSDCELSVYEDSKRTVPTNLILPAVPAPSVSCPLPNSEISTAPASAVHENEPARTKRSRQEETDTQAKILLSLSNLAARELTQKALEEDEDRMFLLSLVSSMKRVPLSRKIQVKSEITAIIARASQ